MVAVELITDAEAGLLLIGKGGAAIRDLEAESKCSISVNRDGPNVRRDEKMVIVKGDERRVGKGLYVIVRQLVDNGARSGEICINIPPSSVQSIIGSRGSTVNKIQDDSGARISLPRKGDRDEGRVTISGKTESMCRAATQIMEIVGNSGGGSSSFKGKGKGSYDDRRSPRRDRRRSRSPRRDYDRRGGGGGGYDDGEPVPAQFVISSTLARSLVGRGGSVVNGIESKTGSKVSISKDASDSNRYVFIKGGDLGSTLKMCFEILESEINEAISSVHFKIPIEKVPLVVGSKGVTVNSIQSQSQARIDISNDGAFGTVCVSGTIREIVRAGELVYSMINDGGMPGRHGGRRSPPRSRLLDARVSGKRGRSGRRSPPPRNTKRAAVDATGDEIELLISSKITPRLVGSKGARINEIIDTSGATVNIEKGNDNGPERSVKIIGGRDERGKAIQEILDTVDEEFDRDGGLSMMNMLIPLKKITTVVGSGGSTIQNIEQDSGSKISIARKNGTEPPGYVSIKGNKEQCQNAILMLDDIINGQGDEDAKREDLDDDDE